MDYGALLGQAISEVKLAAAEREQQKIAFEAHQRKAFGVLSFPLRQVAGSSAGCVSLRMGELSAVLKVAGPWDETTSFDIRPNFDGGILAPTPAPGFMVEEETIYNNRELCIDPTRRQIIVMSVEDLMELIIKRIAKALAVRKGIVNSHA